MIPDDTGKSASPKLCISKTTCMADGYGFCNAAVEDCEKCVSSTGCPSDTVASSINGLGKGTCIDENDCKGGNYVVYKDEKTCITEAACAEKKLLVGHSGISMSGECFTRETCADNKWKVSDDKTQCVASCSVLDGPDVKMIPDINGVDCTPVSKST